LLGVPDTTLLLIAGFLPLEGVLILRTACWMILRQFGPDEKVWKEIRPKALIEITKRASAAGLQLLNRLYALSAQDVGKTLMGPRSAFGAACAAGDVLKIQWLARRFAYPFGVIADAAECAVRNGKLPAFRLILNTYSVADEPSVSYPFLLRMLCAALRSGQSQVVRWLILQHSAPRQLVAPRDISNIFRVACRGPSLEGLVVLATALSITRDDVRAHERHYLGDACDAGRGKNARWLVQRYGLTACDLRSSRFSAISNACKRKNFRLASMLAGLVRIAPSELYVYLSKADGAPLWPLMRHAGLLQKSPAYLLGGPPAALIG
jgi:hypothetical protein